MPKIQPISKPHGERVITLTDRKCTKRRKFAHELLALAGISMLVALLLFWISIHIAGTVAEYYCFENDVPMTEFDWIEVDRWILSMGAVGAISVFCILFLALLAGKLAYIRKITQGIDAMRLGQDRCAIPLEGNNELTELADTINYMSATQEQIRQKEQALAQEKEQLVRALSHDIRTPLTSVLAYAEYLCEDDTLSHDQRKAHLQMIRKKAEQIRDLTAILLDGEKQNPEYFSDARLLMEQLAAEFEEGLENDFAINLDLSGCRPFAGAFDVQQLRRIFDNLSSNVQKYAHADYPVSLTIRTGENLVITQHNTVGTPSEQADSHRLGIHSMRRIAQDYGGTVSIEQDEKEFQITITLSDF